MRFIVAAVMAVWMGCATTSSSGASGPTSAAPIGSVCVDATGCPAGTFCVKAVGLTEGVCSQIPSQTACAKHEDCLEGSYCHKPLGQDGVCFKP